jgi:hypothetical protein
MAARYDNPGDRVIEVKYGHDEIVDGGFSGAYYTRRLMKAHMSIGVDARVDPTQHPEIRRLMRASSTNTAITVHDLPGEWLVMAVERVQHEFGHEICMKFSLVQATTSPAPEPPEKIAAKKLAKRILGYDPGAPPEKPSMWGTFDVGMSFDERVSFAGINAASAAKLQAHIKAELLNSFTIKPEGEEEL